MTARRSQETVCRTPLPARRAFLRICLAYRDLLACNPPSQRLASPFQTGQACWRLIGQWLLTTGAGMTLQVVGTGLSF
jgi:hypothetical protein